MSVPALHTALLCSSSVAQLQHHLSQLTSEEAKSAASEEYEGCLPLHVALTPSTLSKLDASRVALVVLGLFKAAAAVPDDNGTVNTPFVKEEASQLPRPAV